MVMLNTWQHVAVVFDPTTSSSVFYKNGQASASLGLGFDANTHTFTIGANPNFNEYFTGQITEVRVWRVVRTATQIADTMNLRFSPPIAGHCKALTCDRRCCFEGADTC